MKQKTILAAMILVLGFGLVPDATSQSKSTPSASLTRDRRPRFPRQRSFQRIATFPAVNNYCGPREPNTCFNRLAVSEIVAASEDGRLLIYTDSANKTVGLVDISNPRDPVAGGTIEVGGEPTSVAVVGRFALVAVNSSPSFTAPSGHLTVIDLNRKAIVPGGEALDLGGQPDSIAISPDKRYAAIAIENERDEELGNGAPPQLPGGKLVRIDLAPLKHALLWRFREIDVTKWELKDIDLTGLADKFPNDPEVEFISINEQNIAAVTLQENNHIVLVDLKTAVVVGDFSAGTVDLTGIDTEEDDVINFNSSLAGIPREPDAVTWISNDAFATADEGDLDGGSRGFTIFNRAGTVLFSSGSDFEHLAGTIGHYPESRSENKGTEPEGITFGRYGRDEYLFVGSERARFVGVYSLSNGMPELVQALPAGVGPEGLLAIPQRNLFVVSSEEDDDDGGVSARTFRASISIYRLQGGEPAYPTVVSDLAADGTPIPWAALSGLGAHPTEENLAYSVSDSYFGKGFIYPMDVSGVPAVLTDRIEVTGAGDLDLEGVAVRSDGSLWLASEGNANGSLANRLLPVNQITGALLGAAVTLPASVDARRTGNGFEGVAVTGKVGVDEKVYVAFQREWSGDPAGKVRIGVYDVGAGTWGFLYYPLDAVLSPNGGWVGLSEITSLGGNNFAVIERDNQAGDNARIKRIYRFSVSGVTPREDCSGLCSFPTVAKTLVRDLMPDLKAPGGAVIEKVEGLAVTADGRTLIDTDNDGVDGSNGETQFIDLGRRVLP